MTKKGFLQGIPALLLVFALIFTACNTPLTEVEGTVGISGQEAPAVTATVVKGGVLLEWNPILDAGYAVWRKAGTTEAIQIADNYSSNSPSQDKKTGKVRFLDLVSDDNELIANTEYTYTVTAAGGVKNIAKTEVKATPTDIPAKGTKLAPVTGVTLVLDQDAETATVTWTEPDGDVPARYSISVLQNGNSFYGASGSAYFGETSATLNWDTYYQTDGEYVARVQVQDLYSSGSNSYFKESDYAVSVGQKFEALFGSGSGSNPSAYTQSTITDTNNTITALVASISFGSAKPGVTYTVERAPVDAAGNAGTYVGVSVYKGPSATDTTALGTADLTADILGNLPNSTVYDKSLPAAGGKFKYQIKATKGTVTQTKETSIVTADPREFGSSLSISFGAATPGTNAQTYSVTPALSPKGVMQAGDRLVIYYVKGDYSLQPQNGPYTQGVEFSKAELEAATVASKTLTIPKGDDDTVVYVQAYVVFADDAGRANRNVSSNSFGGGVNSVSYYQVPGEYGNYTHIYYAVLDY
jgi:hypothetical protein